MEALLHQLIKATGWSILHSLWQGAVIFALLLPTQLKWFKISAKLRYALAYVANCLIFLSFAFTFLSLFQWPAAQPVVQLYQIQDVPAVLSPTFSQYVEKLFPYLAFLYLVGVMIQSVLVYQGYRKIQLLKRAAHLEIPAEWKVLFGQLLLKMKLNRKVSFYLSDYVSVPLIIGYMKPVVLFPVALAAKMEMAQVEAILIHELSHIRRNDYLFNMIKMMIDTLLFFNPFVWLTGKFINIEREHACDDLVVSLTKQPLKYAHALLQLELIIDKSCPVLALAATGKSQHLYQRIKRITDMKTNYINSRQKLIAVSLTIATIFSLAWISPEKSEKTLKNKVLEKNSAVKLPSLSLSADTGKKSLKQKLKDEKAATKTQLMIISSKDGKNGPVIIQSNDPDKTQYTLLTDSLITLKTKNSVNEFAANVQALVLSATADKSKMADLQKVFQANRIKMIQDLDSPEQKAKWTKFGAEIEAKYNSPEEKEKLKKLTATVMFAAQQASMTSLKAMDTLKLNHEKLKFIQANPELKILYANRENANTIAAKDVLQAVLLRGQLSLSTRRAMISEQDSIKQSPEYKELKKKFDKEVAELIQKKSKK